MEKSGLVLLILKVSKNIHISHTQLLYILLRSLQHETDTGKVNVVYFKHPV